MAHSYAIRHVTSFTYDTAVSESVMELRMRPATGGHQRCLQFEVDILPRARVFAYPDVWGNWVHHFDIPRRHGQLVITARSQVELETIATAPDQLASDSWQAIDNWAADGEHWDFRQPSRFAQWTPALIAFAESLDARTRRADPLTTARTVMAAIHRDMAYAPNSTRVDSPIDEALAARRGVCQDFSHIMIAVLRLTGIPCRYVSGYIAPSEERSLSTIATHAWVEVQLPGLGWLGLDPTHNMEESPRHVRVAFGRDYADVPPTRGVFKGKTASALSVSVEVVSSEALPTLDRAALETSWSAAAEPPVDDDEERHRQQQQQQQ
jgi:transglutaminase-like putative cysteine protease